MLSTIDAEYAVHMHKDADNSLHFPLGRCVRFAQTETKNWNLLHEKHLDSFRLSSKGLGCCTEYVVVMFLG